MTHPTPLSDVLPAESGVPPAPVMVMGMHNSGTTVLARVLHRNGVFMANNSGQCESHFFTRFINDRLLMGGGETAWAQLPILDVDTIRQRQPLAERLIRDYWRMDYIQWGYDGQSAWGFKDPRLCVLLPAYTDLFPQAKWVLIRRNIDDIAASLAHREKPGVGVVPDRDFWRALAQAHLDRAIEYGARHAHFHALEYEELCREPWRTLTRLYEFLDLPLPESARDGICRSVRADRVGTRNWSEFRWKLQSLKNRVKPFIVPWYDALLSR
jgi:hypothetical protein